MTLRGVSVEVEGLRKRLGATQAHEGLSARFGAGRIHGLIGPDGAGKTTLLRTLMGLLAPDSGTVTWQVEGRAARFESVRPVIAYMPQRQSLYPDLSIGEHLDFFADLYDLEPQDYRVRRARLLALTRLEPFAERPAGQLSGGMYKKLGLMCALLQTPSVLLLDEPTNGVDPISRREFWDLLYELAGAEILIIVATAYMDEAERCAEVHLVDRGRLLEEGEPREVLARAGAASFDELFIRLGSAA